MHGTAVVVGMRSAVSQTHNYSLAASNGICQGWLPAYTAGVAVDTHLDWRRQYRTSLGSTDFNISRVPASHTLILRRQLLKILVVCHKVGLQYTFMSGHCNFNWEAYLAETGGLALPEAAAVA